MNATLLAVNAKYVHASLAVWFVAGGAAKYAQMPHTVRVAEATINQNPADILARVCAGSPELVGISAYIWNAALLPELLAGLRARLPGVRVLLGGPEAGHNPAHWLTNGADYVLCGEGERNFAALLDALSARDSAALGTIPGLCFLADGTLRQNPQAPPLQELLDPYSDNYFSALDGRIAYIETARGCPFQCAYCLSAGEKVRFFPLDAVKSQLDALAQSGTQTIKLVDRTFNCHAQRAHELLEYVIAMQTDCCFHFEVAADLFDERTLALLQTAPPGRIQLEIGLQSFHMPTLDAVSRKTDLEKAQKNIRRLLAGRNIHIHIDLIAGLPLETLPIFEQSFNRAYALDAHMLQIGFLKLLHGSRLRAQAQDLDIRFRSEPPYEIIRSPWLSKAELDIIRRTENALQATANKGRFLSLLAYVLTASGLPPFAFFRGLGESVQNHATALEQYAAQLFSYCATLPNVDENTLRDCMICDLLSMSKGKNMPQFLKSHGAKRKQTAAAASAALGRTIDYNETAVLSGGTGIFADSEKRDAVTGLYALRKTLLTAE